LLQEHELILVLDFGGQYNHLIARRIRELNVFSEMIPYYTPIEEIISRKPKGIVFSGGPSSVYAQNAPLVDQRIFEAGIPILGICYGMQLIAFTHGADVREAGKREYGKAIVEIDPQSRLFFGLPSNSNAG